MFCTLQPTMRYRCIQETPSYGTLEKKIHYQPSVLFLTMISFFFSFFFSVLLLFTCQLSVEAAQADSESLKSRQRISIIHGKHILANFAKLQNNLVMIRGWRLWWCWRTSGRLCGSNQLEILDWGNSYPPPEVKAPTLQLLMPSGRLVSENQWSVLSLILFITRPNNVWEPGAAELGWVINWFWEGDATERIFKVAREELSLARHSATRLKGWSRDWMHSAVHPSWPPGA